MDVPLDFPRELSWVAIESSAFSGKVEWDRRTGPPISSSDGMSQSKSCSPALTSSFPGLRARHKRWLQSRIPTFRPSTISECTGFAALGYLYGRAGQRAKAYEIRRRLQQTDQHVSSFYLGLVHLGMGDPEQSMIWFERAYPRHDESLMWARIDPRVDELRSNPRFNELLRTIGLLGERGE